MAEKLYNMQMAADYIGISIAAVRARVYREKILTPTVFSGRLFFTEKYLREHKAKYPPHYRGQRLRKNSPSA